MTFANRDLRSLTPVLSGDGSVSALGGSSDVVRAGIGRNLLATAYPAFKSLTPRLFGSLFHFCAIDAAVSAS